MATELMLRKSIKAQRGAARELSDQLREELTGSSWTEGERLPTIHKIMQITNLGYRTVSNAIGILVQEGLLETRRGIGTFVCKTDQGIHRKGRRSVRLKAFALVLPAVRSGLFPSLIHSFGLACEKLGFCTITCNSCDDVGKQGDIILNLIDQQVDGVLLATTTGLVPTPAYHVRQLQNHGIPVVLIHRAVEKALAPVVSLPYEQVSYLAADLLIQRGHRRVAYFSKSSFAHANEVYKEGLKAAMESVGGGLPEALIHEGCWHCDETPPAEHLESLKKVLTEMLNLPTPERPTAIFSVYDPDAELIYATLEQMGARVPQDISLISFGSAWHPSTILKRITSVVADEEQVGRLSSQLLADMCEGRRDLTADFEGQVTLNIYQGESVGKIDQ
ncbi:MAG: GntR family transcriptional regulator [Sedimentisphaerales bacterium]|nr:GntR family transcriptional regulator [Sedimentisphaerales bacterium]